MDDAGILDQRLDTVQAVRPLLNALRMMSLGSRQAAQKQRAAVSVYERRLLALLPAIVARLRPPASAQADESAPAERAVVLMVGSERGLCGRFNTHVAEFALRHTAALGRDYVQVELHVLGKRGRRDLQRLGRQPDAFEPLPGTKLPSPALAHRLSSRWLAAYEARQLDRVDVVFSAQAAAGQIAPRAVTLVPPALPPASAEAQPWPPPIVETDPQRLYVQVVRQWTTLTLYGALLESAWMEHTARYRMMETATQNADELKRELTQALHSRRQQTITREMQELAVSAGLLK